ncbi:MAG: nuclear transport factor 2 family protein [Desulfobacteraceae bacterium]|nr:nuclear transport factor 2 family protein [Desulfobacteraceae bacterium]
MSIKADVENMNAMSLQGKWQEAIEKYYADDVVRKISGLVPLVGRDMIREQAEDFLKGCTEFPSAELKAVAVDEDNAVSMVEWFMEYTHKLYGHIRQSQVCVQRWRDGLIYEESLYVMQEKVKN